MQETVYDPRELERAKQASRDADETELKSGRVSATEMRCANAFIPPEMARAAVIVEWKEME